MRRSGAQSPKLLASPSPRSMLQSLFAANRGVLPECPRERLRTTNCAEKPNEEIRGQERVIAVTFTESSCVAYKKENWY
jgi:hypothetical protein